MVRVVAVVIMRQYELQKPKDGLLDVPRESGLVTEGRVEVEEVATTFESICPASPPCTSHLDLSVTPVTTRKRSSFVSEL